MIRRVVAERGGRDESRRSRALAPRMEHWTFPPRFDADYLPPADSRATGFRGARRCPRASATRAILERLQQLTRYAWEHAPFYRRKWDAAGFHPDQLRSLEDFEAKVPVITKKDLREAQARVAAVRRLPLRAGSTRSTTSTARRARPAARPRSRIGRGDWDAIANAHARIMWGMGIRPGDIVFVAAIFSLYMGSWGALAGAERLAREGVSRSAPARRA